MKCNDKKMYQGKNITMNKLNKTLGSLLLLSSGLATAATIAPQYASALGWEANDMIKNTTGATGMTAATIDQQSLAKWVTDFTTFLLGIAIVLFVLKVVLTAIDRMIFKSDIGGSDGGKQRSGSGGGSSSGFSLADIPFIGAYPQGTDWKDIWKHFALQIAIVAGAWVLVQVMVGVVLFVFSSLTVS
jgi:hypothetical protein